MKRRDLWRSLWMWISASSRTEQNEANHQTYSSHYHRVHYEQFHNETCNQVQWPKLNKGKC